MKFRIKEIQNYKSHVYIPQMLLSSIPEGMTINRPLPDIKDKYSFSIEVNSNGEEEKWFTLYDESLYINYILNSMDEAMNVINNTKIFSTETVTTYHYINKN